MRHFKITSGGLVANYYTSKAHTALHQFGESVVDGRRITSLTIEDMGSHRHKYTASAAMKFADRPNLISGYTQQYIYCEAYECYAKRRGETVATAE